MKWLWIVVLVIAAPLLAIVVVGALLPKAHVASQTATLSQSPDVVWAVVNGPPTWRPDVRAYKELPPSEGHRRWRETDKHNRTITYEATEETILLGAVSLRRLTTRIADKNLPFGGTWTTEVESQGSGSKVTITEKGEVYNPVFRFVSRYIIGHTASIDAYLNALRAKLKTSSP
ncbi:MAG TPA: SRPBCC family protein [Candidatus Angelobacter sp.]